jgi:hypothetical protein
MVTDVRTDLDPPQVLGYLLPSRSRRELRADRILALDVPNAPNPPNALNAPATPNAGTAPVLPAGPTSRHEYESP